MLTNKPLTQYRVIENAHTIGLSNSLDVQIFFRPYIWKWEDRQMKGYVRLPVAQGSIDVLMPLLEEDVEEVMYFAP